MVEIFSRSCGSDRRIEEVKRFLGENRPTIDRIANHLTQGAWSARDNAPVAPKNEPERSSRVGFTSVANTGEIEPRIRISPNDRVVLVDAATSRQIAFIGVVRGPRQDRRFVLATKANGFIAPLEEDLAQRLLDLDGTALEGPDAEDAFARTITALLGLPVTEDDLEAGD